MKKYSLLIISFIVTVCIFVVLLLIEKQNEYNNQLIIGYVLKEDILQYEDIYQNDIDIVYLKNDNKILPISVVDSIDNFDKYVAKQNLKKGCIILKDDLILKSELSNYVKEDITEKVVIPIANVDSVISNVINNNTYINVYVQVNKSFAPKHIENYRTMNIDETIMILYLEKVKPICYLDNNGDLVTNNSMIKSVVIEVPSNDALYLNYIKGKAGFNITVI